MTHFKRIVAVLLALVMVLGLTACGRFETDMAKAAKDMKNLESLRVDIDSDIILGMAVLGEISIGGTLLKVEELANTLQVCLDSGAKKVLLPMVSAGDLGLVPSDLVGAFSLIFYSSPEEAVFKALGVE